MSAEGGDVAGRRPWSRLRRDSLVVGSAVAIDRLTGMLLLPVLTSRMAPASYGIWSQIVVAYALLSNVLLLGFYHSVARYVPSRPRNEVGRTFHGMLALSAACCGAFVVAACVAPSALSTVLFATPEQSAILAAVSVYVAAECLFEFVVVAFLRADGRIQVCSAYQVVKSLARFGVIAVSVGSGSSLAVLLFRLAVADGVLIAVAYGFHVVPSLDVAVFGLGRDHWRRVLAYSLPIVASSVLGWANASINRFFITHLLGLSALGIYSANYSIASIVSLVSLIIPFVIVPHTNEAWNRGDRAEARRVLESGVRYYLAASLPLAVAVGVFHQPLRTLLAAREYAASPALAWVLSGAMVLYGLELITTTATLLQESRFSVLGRGLAVGLNVALCLLLLKRFGIVAAGAASAAALLATVAINVRRLKAMAEFRFPWGALGRIALPGAAMGVVGHLLLVWYGAGTWPTVGAALASVACFVLLECLQGGSVIRAVFRG